MSNSTMEVCPVCQVKIEDGDRVIFSFGPAGTRSRLWARVCQYAKKDGCINQDQEVIGPIKDNDFYSEPPALLSKTQESTLPNKQRKAS